MINSSAIIDHGAKLGKNISIGHGSVIGKDVIIGDNTQIGPYVIIKGPTIIGQNNKIFQFSSLGDEPQDITYAGEPTRLEIGDNNVFREYCMISRGTVKGGEVTKIGNNNYFMAYTHIGHDCIISNHTIMVNHAALSGHAIINDYAIIGPYAAIHQFCQVGAYAFIARATYVTKDVLPYVLIAGHDASVCGINTVGLKRRGFTSAAIDNLRRAYKIIFRKGLTVTEAIAELEIMQANCPEVSLMLQGLTQSTRGVVR